MATGLLGTANLAATVITDVYTVPQNTQSIFNINIVNRGNSDALVRLALSSDSMVQGLDEFIEYDSLIPAKGVLERTGQILSAGYIVTAYSDVSDISVVISGIEEAQ